MKTKKQPKKKAKSKEVEYTGSVVCSNGAEVPSAKKTK